MAHQYITSANRTRQSQREIVVKEHKMLYIIEKKDDCSVTRLINIISQTINSHKILADADHTFQSSSIDLSCKHRLRFTMKKEVNLQLNI